MGDILDTIYSRRSVREYRQEDIPDEIMKDIIKAGTYAPSSMNRQPWRFVIIKNRELIKRLSDIAKKAWLEKVANNNNDPGIASLARMASSPTFNIFYDAPVLVLIFSSPDAYRPEVDCALAAENMMLAARSYGIGSCWIGLGMPIGSDSQVMKELGIPEGHTLMAPVIFGYPGNDEQYTPPRKEDVILKIIK
ncbi:nitroreductase [Methanocella sp. CWC-04]|uniref:Nitroreductase n=2 Tax=Methanooceanicella nereidis TaxID=2052831 RepID=A0AAP2RCA6_9EURY|nr:nitroreductase [Methanocella sp. CWC-04]MCD1293960.1 nitroreductase [Methanocella sp. CWC-04]